MKVRKKFAIPKNERKCLTVSGAGHSTMAATFDSVGAQPSTDNRKPKNSTSDRNSSVFEPLIKSSCVRNVSKTALSLWRCSTGSSELVNINTSSQYTTLILVAFITGNSSLEPLIEGLYAQIHVNLR